MTTEKGIRTAEELYSGNVPYSDMTEDEIERIVEYKAALKFRDDAYTAALEEQAKQAEELRNIHLTAATRNQERFVALCKKAGDGYEQTLEA